MFRAGFERFKVVDPYISFGGYLWQGAAILGLPVGALMAWALSQLNWFWETFQWAGVIGVGLVTWLFVGIGLNLYKHLKPAQSRPISIYLIIAGVASLVLVGALIGYSRSQPSSGASAEPIPLPLPPPQPDAIKPPPLNTQIAKEGFQKALDEFSIELRTVDKLLQIAEPLAGNGPMVRSDFGAGVPLGQANAIRSLFSEFDLRMFANGPDPFFKRYNPSQQEALKSIFPRETQNVWGRFNMPLYRLTVALQLAQDAERHKEDIAMYNRAVQNAESWQENFRQPTGELHQWLNTVRERLSEMEKKI
jgi:hypothetical protein